MPVQHTSDSARLAISVRPASFAQQRLWFLAQLPGANAAYNETLAFELTGPLDQRVLTRALDEVTDRHTSLRTRLVAEKGRVHQHIDPPGAGFLLTFEDLSRLPDADAHVARCQRAEAERRFDLAEGPLGRGHLLALEPQRHVLLLTFHHTIYDGVSMSVMMREIGLLYEATLTGAPHPLPDAPAQYADHAQAQLEAVRSGALAAQEEYWKRALRDAPPVLELPVRGPRPAEQDYAGGRVAFEVGTEVTADLRRLAREHGATLFVAVLTAWAILLSRLRPVGPPPRRVPPSTRPRHGADGVKRVRHDIADTDDRHAGRSPPASAPSHATSRHRVPAPHTAATEPSGGDGGGRPARARGRGRPPWWVTAGRRPSRAVDHWTVATRCSVRAAQSEPVICRARRPTRTCPSRCRGCCGWPRRGSCRRRRCR
ncbi:condensation domain-containing protein [Streptomyces violaceorubidus]|uniref:Condensation domain-containing protein n=1 Tax=Streptomyces violaceorubidus TaxID=284042 RepID=A0ABV1T324_9ACTN